MAEMGLGYGSEFHLLRMLGRHRNSFEEAILKALKYQNGQFYWFDFNFDKTKELVPDKELIGYEFLKLDPNFEKIKKTAKNFWPRGKFAQNWDAICKIGDEYLLIEAKAHAIEMQSDISKETTFQSKSFIFKQFERIKKEYNIQTDNDWTEKYYQKANRILFLDYLLKNGIKAKLLFVYFLNGYKADNKNITDENMWKKLINQQDDYLGITNNMLLKDNIFNLIIPTNSKE